MEPVFAKVLQGKEGIKTVFIETVKQGEYYHLVVGVKVADFLGQFFHQLEAMKKKQKVISKLIPSESTRNDKNKKKDNKRNLW